MTENTPLQNMLPPLGCVESHSRLLDIPSDNQLLYKMMTVENLLRSIVGNYLYFNRVDSYIDFPNADQNDGRQLPKDQPGNESLRFEKAPNFSAADYYNQSRTQTYACCFSLKNSDYIWKEYGNGSEKGKVCVVFEFGKLRAMLNQTLQQGNAGLEDNDGNRYRQIFSLNYGIVEYCEWENHQENIVRYPNPIKYIYLKDNKFAGDNELRISLSTIGIGKFVLKNGSIMQFPPGLQLSFNFRSAFADKTIQQILSEPDTDSVFLSTELHKLGFVVNMV